jgi:hypothetical protein
MSAEPQPGEREELTDGDSEVSNLARLNLEKRFKIALALYGLLALLVWFTIGEDKVLAFGKPVDIRLVPLVVIGGMVLRTVLARQAEKIRQSGSEAVREAGENQAPGS